MILNNKKDKRKNIIFTHVPKTGGTSIEKAFGFVVGDGKGKHANIKLIKNHLLKQEQEDYYKEAFKFTIVRNPFDQLYSFWNYHVNIIGDISVFKFEKDFNDFLKNLDLKNKTIAPHHNFEGACPHNGALVWGELFQKQYAYTDGKLEVAFIGRFENLYKDFSLICKITGLENKLPQLNNAGKKLPYWARYDIEGRKIAEELLEEDLKTFGYKF